ncbi:hypothetical protein [Lysinibacillus sp. JNUCC-52]|uniref:hypothetical protein n=1 Tax=Lysinibacillus sp. JNUCC-52 TaxID=2792480 RepID=UPI0019382A45|nr:hypothetical protein JNUCC52_02255 [Lysinibacillus sp. JNUCC-52]
MGGPILPQNELFLEMKGKNILLVTERNQLSILGQTFRPIFCGKVAEVTNGYITLDPVTIKMHNAPFFKFPTPLSFPMEHIAVFTPFDCKRQLVLV